MKKFIGLFVLTQAIGATLTWASSSEKSLSLGNFSSIVLKNKDDLKWERMLPELGENSPVFSILRVDSKTRETTIKIRFPKAIYIPKHTHNKAETHIILGGSHIFEHNGQKYEVKEHGYIYMPGKFVHEAWVPAGAEAIIILEDGWKVDWITSGPTAKDVGVPFPPM